MTMVPTTVYEEGGARAAAQARSVWGTAWHKLVSRRLTMACLVVLGLYAALALLSFTPYFSAKVRETVGESYQAPRMGPPAVWLGTDVQGQSVFWRVLYGTRIALTIAVVATARRRCWDYFLG